MALPVINFDPITFGIDIVVSIIGGLFGGIFGGLDIAAVQQGLVDLRQATAEITDWLKRFAWTIATALGALLGALKQIFEDLLDKIKTLLQDLWKILKWIIQKAIPAILKAIQALRKWLAMIYQKYIRPLMIYLQYVRRFLFILELLHVKFAAKLDQWISTIQYSLLSPLFYLMRSVNGMGNWINVILTAGAIIQRPVFINTMYAYQADWINMFWQAQSYGGVPGGTIAPPPPAAGLTVPEVAAGMQEYATTGGGEYADYVALAQNAFAEAAAGTLPT